MQEQRLRNVGGRGLSALHALTVVALKRWVPCALWSICSPSSRSSLSPFIRTSLRPHRVEATETPFSKWSRSRQGGSCIASHTARLVSLSLGLVWALRLLSARILSWWHPVPPIRRHPWYWRRSFRHPLASQSSHTRIRFDTHAHRLLCRLRCDQDRYSPTATVLFG